MKNKAIKMTCLAGVLLAVSAVSQVATAGVSANAAATSNYVWRGVTQTNNGSAVSGGLDYEAPFGIYVGTWVSNTALGSQELDIYGGWATEFGPVGFDVGVISYSYPQFNGTDDPATANDERDSNWIEAYVGASVTAGPVDISGQVNITQNVFGTDEQAVYLEGAAEMDLPGVKGATVAAHVGNYVFDVDASDTINTAKKTGSGYDDYIDVSVSVAYDAWTFTFSDTNLESNKTRGTDFSLDDRVKFFVTYARDWTLLK